MTTHLENIDHESLKTHETVPTQYIEVNGTKIAYRAFGKQSGVPLIFLQHFVGNMDNWDPEVTNALSKNHYIILFDNNGVGRSEGKTPESISEMANDAIHFINALGFSKVDILGFSLGGFIAQEIVKIHSVLVRKLILAGTGQMGGDAISSLESHVKEAFKDGPDRVLINLFFEKSESSIKAGEEFLDRLQRRIEDRDIAANDETFANQLKAIVEYGDSKDDNFIRLKNIQQPTLIVNGNNDTMVHSINSFTMAQHIPDSKLVMWSNSGHGSIFQNHNDFVLEIESFLNK